MPASNARGIPYVLPTDKPVEFPTHSQQLADAIAAGQLSAMVPMTGWADYGGAHGGLFATRIGPTVTLDGFFKRTSNLSISSGSPSQLCTLPVGWRPARNVYAPCFYALNSAGSGVIAQCELSAATGVLTVYWPSSGTLDTTGWVSVVGTFRGAAG